MREAARIEALIRDVVLAGESRGVVVGSSGGVDSAVALALCARALGSGRVLSLMLPSGVTSERDIFDVQVLCDDLGVENRIIRIDPILQAYAGMPDFDDAPFLVGNLMARIRMTILYYHANREGLLVCGTSNKSEYLLGYCTKYGDNAADFQPIVHLYKSEIFGLAYDLGVPASIIEKIPSAGLWRGQSDEEELGAGYAAIDAALRALEKNGWAPGSALEEDMLRRVVAAGHKRRPPASLLPADQAYPA